MRALPKVVANTKVGKSVVLKIWRDKKIISKRLILGRLESSKEFKADNKKLKLTEKEVNTIIYLSKKMKTVSIKELQKNVWRYQSNIETHTVETHIYRLRKKISEIFKDEDFIVSKKNGYQIK